MRRNLGVTSILAIVAVTLTFLFFQNCARPNEISPSDLNSQGPVAGDTSASGGAAVGSKYVLFTESNTFVVPPGVTSVRVVAIGGGGGGGGNSCSWGSGGGGGCGGGVVASTVTVKPGDVIPVTIGGGGAGGAGCASGVAGTDSSLGVLVIAPAGSWGFTGNNNLFQSNVGGVGGGSGGGGGGNGFQGYAAVPGSGGTAGTNTNSLGTGGACTGSGWPDLTGMVTKISYSAGAGGSAPVTAVYFGGGGGGGLVFNNSTITGSGSGTVNLAGADSSQGSGGVGGAGYGGGGAGSNGGTDGAAGAPGAIYVEW